jgi:hypothetical protein
MYIKQNKQNQRNWIGWFEVLDWNSKKKPREGKRNKVEKHEK